MRFNCIWEALGYSKEDAVALREKSELFRTAEDLIFFKTGAELQSLVENGCLTKEQIEKLKETKFSQFTKDELIKILEGVKNVCRND